MNDKISKWMNDPKCYSILKEKKDGLVFGPYKIKMLEEGVTYLLPSVDGDKLVSEGIAIEVKPNSEIIKYKEEVNGEPSKSPSV